MWWGHASRRLLKRSQYSKRVSLSSWTIVEISFLSLSVTSGEKNFSRNSFLSVSQLDTFARGWVWYHSLAYPARENEKAFSKIEVSSVPSRLIVEQAAWKSLKCLMGSWAGKPWNLGIKFSSAVFISKSVATAGWCAWNGCIVKLGAPSSWMVTLLAAMSPARKTTELVERGLVSSSNDVSDPPSERTNRRRVCLIREIVL